MLARAAPTRRAIAHARTRICAAATQLPPPLQPVAPPHARFTPCRCLHTRPPRTPLDRDVDDDDDENGIDSARLRSRRAPHAHLHREAEDAPVQLAFRRTLLGTGSPPEAPLRLDEHDSLPPAATNGTARVLPVVLMHCLLGDGAQFSLLQNRLHAALQKRNAAASSAASAPLYLDLWCPDARNHGRSAHRAVHSYSALVQDLAQFVRRHSIRQPIMAGHSMSHAATPDRA